MTKRQLIKIIDRVNSEVSDLRINLEELAKKASIIQSDLEHLPNDECDIEND